MRWTALVIPLILLIEILVFVNFYSWQVKSLNDFEQKQLDLQVNYCIDAAMQELLDNGTHIDTDYMYWGNIQLEPEVALRIYKTMLLRNWGWSDSEKNREDLEEIAIPYFILASYDGFYVYGIQKNLTQSIIGKENEADTTYQVVDNYTYDKIWSPKIPYSETVISDDLSTKKVYMYYLDNDYYGWAQLSPSITIRVREPLSNGNGPGSRARSKQVISSQLEDAINAAMFMSEGADNPISEIVVPSSYSEWSSSRPIEKPTILTCLTTDSTIGREKIYAFGVGGAKIDKSYYYICYTTAEGKKLYTYAENRDLVNADYRGCHVDIIATSQEMAASMGYYFDIVYQGVN